MNNVHMTKSGKLLRALPATQHPDFKMDAYLQRLNQLHFETKRRDLTVGDKALLASFKAWADKQ